MAVHAFRILTATEQASNPPSVPSPGPPDFAAALLQDRLDTNVTDTHTEVLPDQRQSITTSQTVNGTAHNRGLVRFDGTEDPQAVAEAIRDDVVRGAKWYRVEPHECDYDAPPSERTGCGDWSVATDTNDTPIENGAAPSDV